jgi:two-component system nitrogen regulation response regulator GlnG
MRRVAAQVRRFSRYSQPVFISGETGTGKELVARALHDEGPRAGKPFIPINVAALPRELVESELFGHERGSFTGAVNRRAGAFTEAEGGTLFLDEIGELPLDAQPKLLRALDGYEVRRVGANGGGKRANVRVIAASHVALEERVDAGRFRGDLYHRLAVYVIEVPPLRERRGDIAAIAHRVLAEARDEIGEKSVSSSALARLAAHEWPGNVRELRNVLVRAADIAGDARVIDAAQVERAIRSRSEPPKALLTPPLAKSLLNQHQNNLSAAARAAGYPRTTFRKLLNGN